MKEVLTDTQATLIEFYFTPIKGALRNKRLAKTGLDFGDPWYIWAYDDQGRLWMCDYHQNPSGCFPPTFEVMNKSQA